MYSCGCRRLSEYLDSFFHCVVLSTWIHKPANIIQPCLPSNPFNKNECQRKSLSLRLHPYQTRHIFLYCSTNLCLIRQSVRNSSSSQHTSTNNIDAFPPAQQDVSSNFWTNLDKSSQAHVTLHPAAPTPRPWAAMTSGPRSVLQSAGTWMLRDGGGVTSGWKDLNERTGVDEAEWSSLAQRLCTRYHDERWSCDCRGTRFIDEHAHSGGIKRGARDY